MKKIITEWPIILLITFFVFLFIPYLDFAPFFDGGIIYNVLLSKIRNNSSILEYTSWGHPCLLYFFYSSIFQRLDVGNVQLLHLGNILLGSIAVFCFFRLVKLTFPKKEYQAEIVFVTALFAFSPLFTISALNYNYDFGLVCFFLIFLYLLIARAHWLLILTVSLFMLFSKEPGIVLYSVTVTNYLVFFIFRKKEPLKKKLKKSLAKLYLIIPPLALVSFGYYRKFILRQESNWGGEAVLESVIKGIFSFNLLNKTFLTYLVEIFIINFNWLMLLFIVVFAFYQLLLIIFNLKQTKTAKNQAKINLFLFSFPLLVYIYTRFETFANPRYFLSLHPFLVITFYYSLIKLVKNKQFRKTILICLLLLVFVSNFKTLDPVAKKILGTFKFGKHKMLFITSLSKEQPAYGRDQIVYNLEAVQLHYLFNQVYQDLQPDTQTYILKHSATNWGNLYSPLDKKTYQRTFKDNNNLIHPNYSDYFIDYIYGQSFSKDIREEILKTFPNPKVMYYIDVPFFKKSPIHLNNFLRFLENNGIVYRTAQVRTYENFGYALEVFVLERTR